MAQKVMYPGMVNSPETTITNGISESDTIIYVLDPTRVPEPPNLMTLGTGTNAETVKVTEINGSAITVERGFQGIAKSWPAGTVIARNFTEYDYNALKENIEDLEANKETPAGAQAKADAAAGTVQAELNTHKADYTLQVPFGGTTTNSGNNYSIASPPISALTAGMAIAVKINANSTGATTLNWNGKGAKPIKKANGTDVTNLKAGGIYTFRYDGANFILQGEGASGNATASDLLSGKTATTDAGEIVGTMPNRGAVANTITTQGGQYTIPAGYHNGAGKVTATFANLVAENIKSGVNIGGVVGTLNLGGRANKKMIIDYNWYDPSMYRSNYGPSSPGYYKINPTKTLSYATQLRKDGSGYYTGGFGLEIDITNFSKICFVGRVVETGFHIGLYSNAPRTSAGEVSATRVNLGNTRGAFVYEESNISGYTGSYWVSIYTIQDSGIGEVECIGFWVE